MDTYLGHTSERSGNNGVLRLLVALALDAFTLGYIDYLPNANRKWCFGPHGRGYTLIEAVRDAWGRH
jgi:hypothetical protein